MATIGSLLLLSISLLSINRNEMLALESMWESKMNQYAVNIAKSYMDEVKGLAYDETSLDDEIDYVDPTTSINHYYTGYDNKWLSYPLYFGIDAVNYVYLNGTKTEDPMVEDLTIESKRFDFDDVDDYNGFSLIDSLVTIQNGRTLKSFFNVRFEVIPVPKDSTRFHLYNQAWMDDVISKSGIAIFDQYAYKVVNIYVSQANPGQRADSLHAYFDIVVNKD